MAIQLGFGIVWRVEQVSNVIIMLVKFYPCLMFYVHLYVNVILFIYTL